MNLQKKFLEMIPLRSLRPLCVLCVKLTHLLAQTKHNEPNKRRPDLMCGIPSCDCISCL